VRQDAPGLELVGVRPSAHDKGTAVHRPELQAFVGALHGAQTIRGVFVTTARFSAGAKAFAEGVSAQLGLIVSEELTRLMVRYNVAVSAGDVRLKQIDEEFFKD
jgi:restriction system protein